MFVCFCCFYGFCFCLFSLVCCFLLACKKRRKKLKSCISGRLWDIYWASACIEAMWKNDNSCFSRSGSPAWRDGSSYRKTYPRIDAFLKKVLWEWQKKLYRLRSHQSDKIIILLCFVCVFMFVHVRRNIKDITLILCMFLNFYLVRSSSSACNLFVVCVVRPRSFTD